MPTVHFLGRVLPPAAQISVGHKPILKWEEATLDLKMEFSVDITNSQIDVECKLNRFHINDLRELHMRSLDLCRVSVNLVAFSQGFGLTVILDTFVDPDGNKSIMTIHNPALARLCTAFALDSSFDAVHLLVLQDVSMYLVLNDLILGMTMTHTAPISCARSIDGIKHQIAIPGSKDKHAWSHMNAALQLSESYVKFITDRSKDPRHGKIPVISEIDTLEIISRSWTIFDRYLHYRLGGKVPLTASKFPLLT